MIKDERDLITQSGLTGCFIGVIFLGLAGLLHRWSWAGGYLVGFLISLFILVLDCKWASLITKTQLPKAGIFHAVLTLGKITTYALGFYIAVKMPAFCQIFCVGIGYLTVKLTVYRLAITRR